MTREEAIIVLDSGDWWEELSEWYSVANHESVILPEAISMAIAALREQPRWISVEDELPESGKRVLIRCQNKAVFVAYLVEGVDNEIKWYMRTAQNAARKIPTYRITYWMPLPEEVSDNV